MLSEFFLEEEPETRKKASTLTRPPFSLVPKLQDLDCFLRIKHTFTVFGGQC